MRRRSTQIRWLACSAALFGMLFYIAPSASAGNFDRLKADGGAHTYAYSGLSTGGVIAADWGVARLDATVLTLSSQSSCLSTTDACIFDGEYEVTGTTNPTMSASEWMTAAGVQYCVDQGPSVCGSSYIRFDENDYSGQPTSYYHHLGCHEMGHGVGLSHAARACMESGAFSAIYLGNHNAAHIDGYYS